MLWELIVTLRFHPAAPQVVTPTLQQDLRANFTNEKTKDIDHYTPTIEIKHLKSQFPQMTPEVKVVIIFAVQFPCTKYT
jgi:hypothetical protein